MKSLAFDMATCTGYCVGDGLALPRVGHIVLPSPVNGRRGPMFSTFRRWVLGLIVEHGPDRIVGEAAILPKAFIKDGRIIYPTTIETTSILQGLWAILEDVAFECDIPCQQIDGATIKKELAGSAKAKKPDMVRAARRIGLTIDVHDEADALAVWLVDIRLNHPRPVRDDWDRRVWSSRGGLL